MNAIVSKKNEGEIIQKDGVKYTVKAKTDKLLVILAELDVGAETAVHKHAGEEFRFVLEGKIECDVGGTVYRLEAGESIVHPSDVSHKIKNIGDEKAVYITVGTPPTFIIQ
uniref:Cupin domain-containing protein n=1 Tax=Geoglobus ahangari TaxID=113653 RepID=A0A7C4WKX6_9EURY